MQWDAIYNYRKNLFKLYFDEFVEYSSLNVTYYWSHETNPYKLWKLVNCQHINVTTKILNFLQPFKLFWDDQMKNIYIKRWQNRSQFNKTVLLYSKRINFSFFLSFFFIRAVYIQSFIFTFFIVHKLFAARLFSLVGLEDKILHIGLIYNEVVQISGLCCYNWNLFLKWN